jgi:hypothetical protein
MLSPSPTGDSHHGQVPAEICECVIRHAGFMMNNLLQRPADIPLEMMNALRDYSLPSQWSIIHRFAVA